MLDKHPEDRPFRATEVGTLLESLRHEMKLFGDGQQEIWKEVSRLRGMEQDIKEIKVRLTGVEDVLRVNVLPRIATLEKRDK